MTDAQDTDQGLADHIQDVLGADVRVPLSPGTADNLEALGERLSSRLVSSGGRPTDPDWTLTRRVPFSARTWQQLGNLAHRLGTPERTVAPAQLAASLLEDKIAELDRAIGSEDTQSRIRGES